MGVEVVMWEWNLKAVAVFLLMVSMEGSSILLTILAKIAISNGRSPFLFVLYSNALASLILLPYSFFFHRKHRPKLPLFTFSLFARFFLLGLSGICVSQNLAYLGLSYSSPIVVCAMGLLMPTFSFLLSAILRLKKNDSSSSCIIKAMGTVISVTGAVMVGLYKGPTARKYASSPQPKLHHQLLIFTFSTQYYWVIGCILLASASFFVSLWNLFQVRTVIQYPQVMKVASFYSLIGTILCGLVCVLLEPDPAAWKLNLNLELLLIVVTAVFNSIIRSHVHIWCMQNKGRFYVPMFKPFGIVFATIFGVSFFGDSFHYGSVIGTTMIGIGYYILMWREMQEDKVWEDQIEKALNISDEQVPLLQQLKV